jgi:hypothetical protein
MSSIIIRFIRNKNDTTQDDMTTISPIWNDLSDEISILEYTIVTKFAKNPENALSSSYSTKQTVNSQSLRMFLCSMLTMMYHDIDPFVAVQFDMPNSPSIIVSVNSLNCIHSSIMNMLNSLIESWPTIQHVTNSVPCIIHPDVVHANPNTVNYIPPNHGEPVERHY